MIFLDHCYEKCTTFHVFYRRTAHNLCSFCIFVCRFRVNDADNRNYRMESLEKEEKEDKHNAELRGTAPGANIPKFI